MAVFPVPDWACAILSYPFKNRDDTALLDGTWFFETICVDTTKKILVKFHVIEGGDGFIPVALDDLTVLFGLF